MGSTQLTVQRPYNLVLEIIMQHLSPNIPTPTPQYRGLPEPTKFVERKSEIYTYYFRENPWKTCDKVHKIFRGISSLERDYCSR